MKFFKQKLIHTFQRNFKNTKILVRYIFSNILPFILAFITIYTLIYLIGSLKIGFGDYLNLNYAVLTATLNVPIFLAANEKTDTKYHAEAFFKGNYLIIRQRTFKENLYIRICRKYKDNEDISSNDILFLSEEENTITFYDKNNFWHSYGGECKYNTDFKIWESHSTVDFYINIFGLDNLRFNLNNENLKKSIMLLKHNTELLKKYKRFSIEIYSDDHLYYDNSQTLKINIPEEKLDFILNKINELQTRDTKTYFDIEAWYDTLVNKLNEVK